MTAFLLQGSIVVYNALDGLKCLFKHSSLTSVPLEPVQVGSLAIHQPRSVHDVLQVAAHCSSIGQYTHHFPVSQMRFVAQPEVHRERVPLHSIVGLSEPLLQAAGVGDQGGHGRGAGSADGHQRRGGGLRRH